MTVRDAIKKRVKAILLPMYPVGCVGMAVAVVAQMRGVKTDAFWVPFYGILITLSVAWFLALGYFVRCPRCAKPIGFAYMFSGVKGQRESAINLCPHCGTQLDEKLEQDEGSNKPPGHVR